MTSPQEKNRPELQTPQGIFRESIGEIVEKTCGIVAVELAQYPQCRINMPEGAPNRLPLLPIFIPDDFRHSVVKLPPNFLSNKDTQDTLLGEVPSLTKEFPVNLSIVDLHISKRGYSSISLKVADKEHEKIATERRDVCTALARILGFEDFDSSQLKPRLQVIKIVRAPKGSVDEEVLRGLEKTINAELPATSTLREVNLPDIRPVNIDRRRKIPKHKRRPRRQNTQDVKEMIQAADLPATRSNRSAG